MLGVWWSLAEGFQISLLRDNTQNALCSATEYQLTICYPLTELPLAKAACCRALMIPLSWLLS